MTEDEAKEKWCPQGPTVATDEYNAGFTFTCIGSKCMAWRWHGVVMGQDSPPRPEELQGYCGLAGRP